MVSVKVWYACGVRTAGTVWLYLIEQHKDDDIDCNEGG